jgi:hypothetical protein
MGKFYPEEVKNKALELNRLDEKTTYADVGRDPEISPERSGTGFGPAGHSHGLPVG